MLTRRHNGALTPLAIVLPHPPLPRRRSSLLSANSPSTPHTPRSCASPSCSSFFLAPANRKSTDSWNSSNSPDDIDYEWRPEHLLLLSRTLDALPAHLVTPFNGPIPPSNLLDKIARGVSEAKGSADWPHSIRATRVKLIELSRNKAKEEALVQQERRAIPEETGIDSDADSYFAHYTDTAKQSLNMKGTGLRPRRPLYRQSSMDFMNSVGSNLNDHDNVSRLPNRPQRTDLILSSPGFHPYPRTRLSRRRESSPPPPTEVPSLINPSTPSSSTLNSLATLSTQPRILRRQASSLSSSSISMLSSAGGVISDPRIQRVKRSDSFCNPPPAPPHKDIPAVPSLGVKRAPSFGAFAQEKREHRHVRNISGSDASSDEEEKARSLIAKKPRTKGGSRKSASPSPSSPSTAPVPPMSPMNSPVPSSKTPSKSRPTGPVSPKEDSYKGLGVKRSASKPEEKKPKMNLQRNPSMFGAELPQHKSSSVVSSPRPTKSRSPTVIADRLSPRATLAAAAPIAVQSPPSVATTPPSSASPIKTLRRVRRLAPARRISFGSLASPSEDGMDGEPTIFTSRGCLGSAFQPY